MSEMTTEQWQEAMRAAEEAYWAAFKQCALLSQTVTQERRAGRSLAECPSLPAWDKAKERKRMCSMKLARLRDLRPPYAPDWVDGMGRAPQALLPEVEEHETVADDMEVKR